MSFYIVIVLFSQNYSIHRSITDSLNILLPPQWFFVFADGLREVFLWWGGDCEKVYKASWV